jgi:uncharacterized NAD(P)/FAD-binding protein YdhS
MGYRSNVTAIFYAEEKDWPLIKLWLDENRPDSIIHEEDFKGYQRGNLRGYYVEYDGVKWYDSYPNMQDFNSYVSKYIVLFCGESKTSAAYEFMRIGENYEDIEVDRNGDYNHVLELERRVIID